MKTRAQMQSEIIEYLMDCNDSISWRYMLLKGFKGFDNMTDDEVEDEWMSHGLNED